MTLSSERTLYYGVGVIGVHVPEGVTACEDNVLGLVIVTCPAPGKAPFNSSVPEAGNGNCLLVCPEPNCTTPVLVVRPPSVVYVNCTAPPGPFGRTLRVAV